MVLAILALLPTCLWWITHVESGLRENSPSWWHTFALLTGILGSSLWAMNLWFIVRLPWQDRVFGGLDQVYFLHHFMGSLAYVLLLAHPLTLALGRWAVSPEAAAALLFPALKPFAIFAGWLALLGLMGVIFATFLWKLPYALWKHLHAGSAVAYALAIYHVVAAAPSSVWSEPGHVLLASYGILGVAALGYRFLIERAWVQRYDYVVQSVTHLNDKAVQVEMTPLGERLAFEPGQFVFVAFFDGRDYKGCAEYHPFTVRSSPTGTNLGVIIKALGDCTCHIQRITSGVLARVQGPYGAFFKGVETDKPQVWVAGGIGITPFLSMAQSLSEQTAPVDLYYLARNPDDFIGLEDLRAVSSKIKNFGVFPLTAGDDQRPTIEAMLRHSGPLTDREFFLCGPPPMVNELTLRLEGLGVPAAQIHTERFDFR
jgi:predicted ferric reductase